MQLYTKVNVYKCCGVSVKLSVRTMHFALRALQAVQVCVSIYDILMI